MAKKKLNVKFLALVIGSLGLGVAVLGLIVLMQFRNDPVRHVKRGDTLMQQGEYENAMQQYIRAIGKDPGEMAYYDLAIDAAEQIDPKSRDRTRELYQLMNSVMAKQVENATADGDLSAKDVRDRAASRLLNNLDVYTYALPRIRDNRVVTTHDMIATRVRDIDASFYGLGEDQVDPRIRSAVRGLVVAPYWRGAYNLDEGDWEDGVEEIREAIELDPGYVPNQYGLLRGMLERFESDMKTAPEATLRRELDGENGLNERIRTARAAVSGPAPELDMIEFERDQILFLGGKTGDDEDDLGSAPDAETMARLIREMRALGDTGLAEYEIRARIVELWWSFYRAISRIPVVELDKVEAEKVLALLTEGFEAASEIIAEVQPEDVTDLRSDYLTLMFLNPPGDQAEVTKAIELINDVIEKAEAENRLGPDLYAKEQALNLCLQKRFDLGIRESPMNEVLSEEARNRLDRFYTEFRDLYPDQTVRDQDPRWARVELLYNTRLAMDSEQRAALAEDPDLERALKQDSLDYSKEATKAARACEREGSLIDGLALEAAILVSRRTGEVGTATRLYKMALERNSTNTQDDLPLQVRLAEMLAQSGDLDGANEILDRIRDMVSESDQDTLERIVRVEDVIRQSESGQNLEDLPGLDLLNEVVAARIAGDIDEVRRLQDEIIEGRNIDRQVRLLALLDRAGLEEAEGNYDEMRMFATRALEIDPRSIRAKIFMKTDSKTTTLDRTRTMSETQFDDPQDIDVQQARNISNILGQPGSIPEEQLDEMRVALTELQERIENEETLRPMALSYLFERSVMAGDFAEAGGYLDQLTLEEGGDTPRTIAMAASLAQAQGDLDGAVRIYEDAIDTKGFGSDTMRLLLGEAYAMRGDREDARAQFHEAFKQAPNRWKNALRYGQALITEGMIPDALQVLRAGRSSGRANPSYRDTWLYVEIQTGNFENAIEERRRLYRLDQFDLKNAIELARLLAESPIGRQAILHTETNPRTGAVAGEIRFTPVAWGRLSREDRRTFQIEAREARLLEARGIFTQLRKNDPTSPDVVVGAVRFGTNHPELALEGDLIEQAETALRQALVSRTGMERLAASGRLSRILAEKGRLAYEAADYELADACFEEAIQQESRTVDEAVTAIVSSLYGANDLKRAAKYQAVLLQRMEDSNTNFDLRRRVASRLATMHVGSGDLDSASEVADMYLDLDSNDSGELTVLGTISFGKADRLRRDKGAAVEGGLPDEVLAELDVAEEIYERALAVNARNTETLLQLAAIAEYRWLYSSKDEREAAFDNAVKAARRAVENNRSYWPARLRLVTLLAREDEIKEAITELRDHLELMPDTNQARSYLIQMLEQDGRMAEAIDLAQASLERDSTNIEWARALGRLRGINKEYSEAAQLFGALYAQTGDIAYLRSQVMSLMAWTESDGRKPGAAMVVDLVRSNQRDFSRDQTLIGAYCAALIDVGRVNEGLRNYETSYRKLRGRPTQERLELTRWLTDLYPNTTDGAAELSAFLRRISDEQPSVIDLIAVARAWDSIGQDGLEAAISTARQAVAVDADEMETASALGLLGILLTKNEDCAGALDAFERALALRREDSQLFNNIAYLTAKCDGDLDMALEKAEQAVKARPYRSEFRDTLGAVRLARARAETDPEQRQLEYDRARQELTLATRFGTTPSPHIQLAKLEIELGNYDEAREHVRQAGDLNPNATIQGEIDAILEELKGR